MSIRPAEPGDLDAVYDLLLARSRDALGDTSLQRRQVETDLGLAGSDHLVAVDGALVVGYGSLDSRRHVDLAAPASADELLAALEARARERGFEQVSAVVVDTDVRFDELVRRSGYEHRADVLRMWATLEHEPGEPVVPDGVTVRCYRDEDAPRVHRLLDEAYEWDETYAARPHAEWLAWMTGHDEFDPELWLLAERDGALVGCALHWRAANGNGWLKDLAVRAGERGGGLGRALVLAGFAAYARRGVTRVGLKVDSTNPTGAVRLYERMGFVADRRFGAWVKGL